MENLLVSRAEAGQKILHFLDRRVAAGQNDLHRWIRSGQVRRNGGRIRPFARVAEGDHIRVPPFAVLHGRSVPVEMPGLVVVYENADILVVDKPSGLATQGGNGQENLAAILVRRYAGADFVPAPVHRLDKDTSGLLLAGKTYAALRRLSDALAGRSGETVIKEYLAWVRGAWPEREAREMRDEMVKDKRRTVVLSAGASGDRDDGSKIARCFVAPVRCMKQGENPVTLLLVRLLTGRTHQIRAQLAARGFPVVGDRWYGGYAGPDAGLKLHAARLVVPGEERSFTCLPPWPAPWNVDIVPGFPEGVFLT